MRRNASRIGAMIYLSDLIRNAEGRALIKAKSDRHPNKIRSFPRQSARDLDNHRFARI